jgi:hypothetical protein
MVIPKYNYTIIIREDIKCVDLVINSGDIKNQELVSLFFNSDIQGGFNSLKVEIMELNRLLSGECEIYECSFNATYLEANKNSTKIEDLYPEYSDNPKICEIETVEFKKFLLIWAREYAKYKYKIGKIREQEKNERIKWIEEQ